MNQEDLLDMAKDLLDTDLTPTVIGTTSVFLNMADLIKVKNERYGDAATNPIQIFTNHLSDKENPGTNSILVRLDDKVCRIKNSKELNFNDIADMMGYLSLLCQSKGWTEKDMFDKLKD